MVIMVRSKADMEVSLIYRTVSETKIIQGKKLNKKEINRYITSV